MSSHRNDRVPPLRSVTDRVSKLRWLFASLLVLVAVIGPLHAQSLDQGVAAFKRQDYVAASRAFIPLAERGSATAQSHLGFMFETGRGVPRNYTDAAMWYRRAAEQGDCLAPNILSACFTIAGRACRGTLSRHRNCSISRDIGGAAARTRGAG